MYTLSMKSQSKLDACHPDLQRVVKVLLRIMDVTVLEGKRSKSVQKEYVRQGRSQTLKSKHLVQEDGYAHAVDLAPYPINWKDTERFAYMQGLAVGIGEMLYREGINTGRIRSGIDWDLDGNIKEHSLFDGPHIERIEG